MFDIKKDIQAMTTFRRNPGEFMKRLKKTKRPLILTVNGKAEAVVQDAEAYQRLLDIAAQADAVEGIRQGLEELKKAACVRRVDLWKCSAASMKYLVRLTGRSLRDMEVIYNYVEGDASQYAFAWFNRLAKQFIVWSDVPAAARSSLKQEASPNPFWKATSRLQNYLRRG